MSRSAFDPVRMVEAELSRPLTAVRPAAAPHTGRTYTRALCVVRLHGAPLGLVPLELGEQGLGPAAVGHEVWRALNAEINAHLLADGLPAADSLGPCGLGNSAIPTCLQERAALLANAPELSVVVPTRDRPGPLSACLRSLLAADYPRRFEIVIVDNAPASSSTYDLVSLLRSDRAQVRYVREDRRGPSWARNRGLQEARAELVVFVDDDTVVDPGLLTAIVAAFRAADDVGAVTGLILPAELETPAQLLTEEFGGYDRGFDLRVYDTGPHRPADPLYPFTAGRFGSGACMAFRASLLCELGGFDPALGSGGRPCGGEELAAFVQVVRRGHRLVYTPHAIVHHAHHRDYDRLRRQVHGYGVGLGAYLSRCVAHEPGLVLEFGRRLPCALWYLLAPGSAKNERKSSGYPRELTVTELRGLLGGPLAYIRGRASARELGAA